MTLGINRYRSPIAVVSYIGLSQINGTIMIPDLNLFTGRPPSFQLDRTTERHYSARSGGINSRRFEAVYFFQGGINNGRISNPLFDINFMLPPKYIIAQFE
ncbi:hypothetical protein DJ564_25760 [Pseudomonas sp. 31-12]|nr:hypothetical protein DJ564_25760 [Pseudomonas sp. 31-12]